MSLPTDRDSLLAAWKAIGPCEPFPQEAEGIILAYFKHVQLHGEKSRSLFAVEHSEKFSAPPTRFVRQSRANKKAPLGPTATGSAPCSIGEGKSTCAHQRRVPSAAVKSDLTGVSHCCYHDGMEKAATGPRADGLK